MPVTIAVLHGTVPADAGADDLDSLVQVEAIGAALARLGYRPEPVAFAGDVAETGRRLEALRPALVFNLVEAVNGAAADVWLGAQIPESLGLPCTGAGALTLRSTASKIAVKQRLDAAGLPTPAWLGAANGAVKLALDGRRFIIKSDSEHASRGLDDNSVVAGTAAAWARIAACQARDGGDWFAEQFIDGREFNLSLIGSADGVDALPVAELVFDGFPAHKPRIVGYAAKWDESSFEYRHTRRSFALARAAAPLAARMAALARECWELFGLSGYARVDFRVDAGGRPWILEINTNPCLSPDAGLAAAAAEAGIGYDDLIARIVVAALAPRGQG